VPAGAAGGLATVGGINPFWGVLAAFAILAAGQAMLRILPRNGEL
jgi:hypothetical protein